MIIVSFFLFHQNANDFTLQRDNRHWMMVGVGLSQQTVDSSPSMSSQPGRGPGQAPDL